MVDKASRVLVQSAISVSDNREQRNVVGEVWANMLVVFVVSPDLEMSPWWSPGMWCSRAWHEARPRHTVAEISIRVTFERVQTN